MDKVDKVVKKRDKKGDKKERCDKKVIKKR